VISPNLTPHPAVSMYYVYVLKNYTKNKLYYGCTQNLKQRLSRHQKQRWELVYYEAYKSKADAYRRERRLKDYGQAASGLKSRIRESVK